MRKYYTNEYGHYSCEYNRADFDQYIGACINTFNYADAIIKELKRKLDVDQLPGRVWIELIYEAREIVDEHFWNKATKDVEYRNNAEKQEYEGKVKAVISELSENVVEYMVFNRHVHVYSDVEESYYIKQACENIVKGIDSLNPYQRRVLAWKLTHKPNETAPTLPEGYFVLACLLFFEGFFFQRIWLWAITIILFIRWRRKQIDMFNKRR